MMYRFDAAWNGEVLAEARSPQVKSYLGLNFPASDIPKQARDLFQNSGVRMIVDVHCTPSPLIGAGEPRSIDLGASSLRNVSPIHIQYLKNMGVQATLVGSLVVDGRLWGLVSATTRAGQNILDPPPATCFDGPAKTSRPCWARPRRAGFESASTNCPRSVKVSCERIRSTDFESPIRDGGSAALLAVVGTDGFAYWSG